MDEPSRAKQVRRIILERSKSANAGHIGSALSIVEILVSLYWGALNHADPKDPQRDRFILSKGHAALALYAVLFMKGWLTEEQLNSFCCDDSHLGVHPDSELPGIDFSTGSLGMGLSFAAGAAKAAKLAQSPRRVFVLLSDAECNEGSLWEAAMFAAHHKLDNLVAIVDLNGQQALGYTKDVLELSAMEERWRAFGWDSHCVDGHDIDALSQTIKGFTVDDSAPDLAGDRATARPHVVIANTTFGKGVSYMHNLIKWHYNAMTEAQYELALGELEVAR